MLVLFMALKLLMKSRRDAHVVVTLAYFLLADALFLFSEHRYRRGSWPRSDRHCQPCPLLRRTCLQPEGSASGGLDLTAQAIPVHGHPSSLLSAGCRPALGLPPGRQPRSQRTS